MDLATLGKDPIHPDRPTGEDVRYHPLFDQLQAEVDRSSLPSLAGAVDWEKVVSISSEILSTKSKDLLVAGYLAVGLIHTRKMAGLAMGLKIYRDMVEQHGPNLFPQRQRGRLLSMEWLKEKSAAAVILLEGSTVAPDDLKDMQEDLAQLHHALGEMLPEAPPLQGLKEFLSVSAGTVVPDAPDVIAPTPQSNPESGQHVETPLPVAQQAAAQPANLHEALEGIVHGMRQTAAFLRELDQKNPVPYRLTRQAAWLQILDLPPGHSGRTLLPRPAEATRKRLINLQEVGDSTTLLKEVEGLLYDFIFWLDLNRYAATALSEIGGASAAAAIRQETSFLLQRVPGLDELCFADGTPFADAETKEWLRKNRGAALTVSHDRGRTETAAEPAEDGTVAKELEAAATFLREGNSEAAVTRLQEGLRKSVSERERLQRRLALSRVLVETENSSLALPHLEQVVTDLDRFSLDSYDPELALEGLKLAWHAYDSQQDSLSKQKAKEILHRIGRIDLAEMIRLTR
jgi:type VI secretion system protein VasJ